MNNVMTRETVTWLRANPSLDELCERFPGEWEVLEGDLTRLVATGDLQEITGAIERASKPSRDRESTGVRARLSEQVASEVRRQMTVAALRQACIGLAAGVDGRVRFNLVNGWLLQRSLFEHGLHRKPVTMRRFNLVWRLAWQRRFLMPLVQPKGIYCFYSRELIDELATIIGQRSALEIAAGDGTLTRFLNERGSNVVATDDHSWEGSIKFPEFVQRKDARAALRAEQPEVVLCSWPPPGNKFERDVFSTRSVQTYILITTRHEYAAGNWDSYRRQGTFEMEERADLGRLVLPPDLDPVVLVFRRI